MGNLLDIIDKLDINYIDSFAKELSLTGCTGGKKGFRTSGSSGEFRAAELIRREMVRIGLKNVSVEEFPADSWGLLDGSLSVDGMDMEFEVSAYAGSAGTPTEGITGRILDVGKGRACDYEGLDAEGCIVLCTMDPAEDFWVNVPAEQAKARGASGILISYAGEHYSLAEDAVGCFDFQGPCDFPAANISRRTADVLRDFLSSSQGIVSATLKLDIDMQYGSGTSRNVTGYIPGELTDRYIIIGAHMDGYFNAYQDDVIGIGVNMSIAKAIISSGIRPRHTIVFIAHGSEEYGAADSRYDWCIGSYYAVNRLHPEWFGRTDMLLNFDAFRPDAPGLVINAAPEYGAFLGEFAAGLRLPEGCWPEGVSVSGLHGPWSDDYNYVINGVPGLICGKGPSEWGTANYHTNFDNYTIFKTERRLVEYIAGLYIRFIDLFDDIELPPFDFVTVMQDFEKSLDKACRFCEKEIDVLHGMINKTKVCAGKVYRIIRSLEPGKPDNIQHDEVRMMLFDTYRAVQKELYKLDLNDKVIFAHEAAASNCISIKNAVAAVKNRHAASAIEILKKTDLNMYAADFDGDVYAAMMRRLSPGNDRLFWGEGRLHRLYDGSDVISMLKRAHTDSEFADIADALEAGLDQEVSQLKEIINSEIQILEHVYKNLNEICMCAAVSEQQQRISAI